MSCSSRREFLKTMASAGALLACSGCSGSTSLPTTDVAAGNVSALAIGSLGAVAGAPIALGRDPGGLYAMTAICTHQQCDMTSQGTINAQGFFCSCHGSQFDATGDVTHGPAQLPLAHLGLSVDSGGAITIHPSQQVDASTRVAV